MTILVLNAGSTSVKFALFDGEDRRCGGQVSRIGARPRWSFAVAGGAKESADIDLDSDRPHAAALAAIFDALEAQTLGEVAAVAHRVVHGGLDFAEPVVIDADIVRRLTALIPLAPLHQPYNLAGVAMAEQCLPGALQVAAFDTAFHAAQPRTARLYALPRRFIDAGVIRYGFHGLSYDHVAGHLRRLDPERGGGRVIAAHLGGGASLCAMQDGRSVAATMGFTALDGVPMGTRVGDLDPGAVLHMIEQMGLSPAEVGRILSAESGLFGLSGVSGDMQTLLASAEPAAEEAIAVFVYRIVREIGSLAAALGGLDTLVFTGGIGEHAATVRARIADAAAWLGVTIDPEANAKSAPRIDAGGAVAVRIVAADEESVLAKAARAVLARADAAAP